MPTDNVHIKFMIQIPQDKWMAQLSRHFPDLTLQILSVLPLNPDMGNALIQVKGPNIQKFYKAFINDTEISSAITIFQCEDFVLLNVQTRDPWILRVLIQHHVLMNYPIIIRNGEMFIEILAERAKIDQVLTEFETRDLKPIISRIGRYTPAKGLTNRQAEVLQFAVEYGFLDIPRKISLQQIGHHFGISSAATSENLRRAFRVLSINYFNSQQGR